MTEKEIYAIYDVVAEEVVGGLMAFTHDAPVVRIFVDGLSDPQTILNKHPEDYVLLSLGTISGTKLEGFVSGERTVLTGKAWKEAQQQGSEAVK